MRAQHHYDEAIPEYETVIALNRNWAVAFDLQRERVPHIGGDLDVGAAQLLPLTFNDPVEVRVTPGRP